jgi:hypothetical protein
MKEKGNVKVIKTNVVLLDARCLALWEDQTEKTYAALEGVPILPQEVVAIGIKGMRRRVVPVKSWGWAATLPVTKKTGVVIFVPKSKQALQVGPIATRFQTAKAQSDAAKALGDIRPFIMVAMPDGTTDGIVLMSLSEFSELAAMLTSP